MPDPRVLVAMPTRGYPYAPSLLRAADLARRFGHELTLEMGRPIELVRTRIAIRFLASMADALLTIDDDIVAPDGAVDRLLALDAAVATATYPIVLEHGLRAAVKRPQANEWLTAPPTEVFAVAQTGLGFTLIRREVFEQIRTPWFQFGAAEGDRAIGEDTWFSNGVTAAGLQILCDGAIHCSHFKDGMDLLAIARW